jgi:hypothetical protein
MDVQLSIVHGEDPIGAVLLQWGTGTSNHWSWKYTPDGYKSGVWRWVRGFTPPFAYDSGGLSRVNFATQWSIIMTAVSYATADDAILNPGSPVYETYLLITSSVWSTDPRNPTQPQQSWFDVGPGTYDGASRGNGVALFKPATETDPDTKQTQARSWPPSGSQLIFWFSSAPKPSELDWDPYNGVSTDVSNPPKRRRSRR